jgi:phosphoribosylanthranilate isomerase
LKIKVCGITNLEDALLCESLGADALGFIFYNGSKRYIEPEAAAEIIKFLSPFTVKVGVFVSESPDFINKTASYIKLNAVQLHGDESPESTKDISLPAIKSFRVDDNFDYEILKQYTGTYYLLDTYSKSGYGGTGKVLNWKKIPVEYKSNIILAGGISADNIEEIFTKVKPSAVDISSSLESEPGKKDKEKVIRFFDKINELKGKTC